MFVGLSPVTALMSSHSCRAAVCKIPSNCSFFGSYDRPGALFTKPISWLRYVLVNETIGKYAHLNKQMFLLLLQAFVSNAYKRQGGFFLCFSQ